ncbi:MAG: polymer-forming cytoskeletal protein [Clostridium sp.]|nr:polymer-forming cytoskeletal protein [Clostridium sp.]
MMSKNKNTAADARAKVGTLIGKGAVFDGNLEAPETIRVDGTVNGNCNCKAMFIVGVEGKINGDITAQNVVISGKVDGDIIAHGKLELLSTAKLVGNITARSLVVDEDASFDGRCTMTNAADDASGSKFGKDKTSQDNTQNNASAESSMKKA